MKLSNLIQVRAAWALFALLLSACAFEGASVEEPHGLRITMKDVYQGVKEGDVVDVPLPNDNEYITVETCIENFSGAEQVIHKEDVFIAAEDGSHVFPVAVGYDQAEVFSWAVPLLEPVGGKRFPHEYYFFLVQSDALMNIPSYQSLGCETSSQFKSLALLFIVQKEIAGQPYALHFLDGEIQFAAKKPFSVSGYIKWGAGLAVFLFSIAVAVIIIGKKKAKRQATLSQEQNQDGG